MAGGRSSRNRPGCGMLGEAGARGAGPSGYPIDGPPALWSHAGCVVHIHARMCGLLPQARAEAIAQGGPALSSYRLHAACGALMRCSGHWCTAVANGAHSNTSLPHKVPPS